MLHYGKPGHARRAGAGHDLHDRADDQRRQARDPRGSATAGPSSPRDRSLSAQWEHTVLVTDTGYEVLTLSAGSPPPPAFVAAGYGQRGRRRQRADRRRAGGAGRPADRARRRRRRCARASATARPALLERVPRGAADRRAPRCALLRAPGAPRRRDAAASSGRGRACRPARRWSRSAATAAASCSRIPTSTCWCCCRTATPPTTATRSAVGRALHHRLLGHRPRDRLERAHRRRMRRRGAAPTSRCRPRCSRRAASAARAALFAQFRDAPPTHAMDADGLPARQDARDAPAPPEVRGHAVLARAQLQGEPGRPARPADRDLGRARRRPRPHLAGSSPRKGLITPFEVRQLQRNEGMLKLIRARLHAIAGRREDRLVFDLQTAVAESFGYRSPAAQRASERADAPLLLGGQGGDAAQPDPDAQHRGAHRRPARTRRCGRSRADFLDRGGMLEVASDDLYERDPHAILETFLVYQQTVGLEGPVGAHAARALQRARR